jgi:hypothetical protein
LKASHVNLGDKFNRLRVLKQTGTTCKVRCDCGVIKAVPTSKMVVGRIKSCGCLKNELASKRITAMNKSLKQGFKHGHTKKNNGRPSPEYNSYTNARSRCNNPNNKDFADYGGRGVRFLFDSFEQFLKELGRRPSKRYTVDRKNNDGNYEPGNIRWATIQQQISNKRPRQKVRTTIYDEKGNNIQEN